MVPEILSEAEAKKRKLLRITQPLDPNIEEDMQAATTLGGVLTRGGIKWVAVTNKKTKTFTVWREKPLDSYDKTSRFNMSQAHIF